MEEEKKVSLSFLLFLRDKKTLHYPAVEEIGIFIVPFLLSLLARGKKTKEMTKRNGLVYYDVS